MRRLSHVLFVAALCAASATTAAVPPDLFDMDIDRMAVDQDLSSDGVRLACTGIGDTRKDPKWAAYPIRVELSNAKNEYMVDAVVALVDAKGEALLVVRCDAPWLLLQPAPGTYAVHSRLMGSTARPRSARFTVPAHGQKRIVLQFPDA